MKHRGQGKGHNRDGKAKNCENFQKTARNFFQKNIKKLIILIIFL
jgi:hypothetical protein